MSNPATVGSLVDDLRRLGVEAGDVLMVHSSMSALGFVVGGPQAVCEALLTAVGASGTIAMPSQSSDWCEPSGWSDPPVPEHWWPTIREQWPAYDPYTTPLRGMGAIASAFLQRRSTVRSAHPRLSVMASGRRAHTIVNHHALEEGFGEGSPLARLYDLDAKVLLLGATHEANTSLHLAECRATWPGKRTIEQGSAVMTERGREWVTYVETEAQSGDFGAVGSAFAATGLERVGQVASATVRVMPQRALVDFAATWFEANRLG